MDDPLVAFAALVIVLGAAGAQLWWAWRVVESLGEIARETRRQRDYLEAIDAKLAAIGNLATKQTAALEKLAGD